MTETRDVRGKQGHVYGLRRRRYCSDCAHRFTTVELLAEDIVTMLRLWSQLKGLYTMIAATPADLLIGLDDLAEDTQRMQNAVVRQLANEDKLRSIPIGLDGCCTCNAASRCPLGRVGSERRCSQQELAGAGVITVQL